MNYAIVGLCRLKQEIVKDYFEKLQEAGLLQHRFGDIKDPTWGDVTEVIARMHMSAYAVAADNVLLAEFMFENFSGRAAQVHFSINPDLSYKEAVALCKECTDDVLHKWKRSDGSPYLETIIGLTPVTHRAGVITVLKAGFKKIAIVPNSVTVSGDQVVDGMFSMKVRDGI